MELDLECQLAGPHQPKNVLTVLEAARTLSDMGWNLTRDHFKEAIRTVVDRTGLLGRWQTMQEHPLIIADTAHNKEGFAPNLERLLSMKRPDQLHFVWGMVNDKDVTGILSMLPKGAHYYFCKPDVPRGLDANLLHQNARTVGLNGIAHPTVNAALNEAKRTAQSDDLIYVGGSTFVVAEVV
jgi:dihydrofolate synthase/folylpolyglutamate synthase